VIGGKPVRITFPSYDIGSTDIIWLGKRVGFCLAEYRNWRAYLFPEATDRRVRPEGCEEVTGRTLGELRRVLRERVELKGPWWTV
jgi:hypothetical protein